MRVRLDATELLFFLAKKWGLEDPSDLILELNLARYRGDISTRTTTVERVSVMVNGRSESDRFSVSEIKTETENWE